jgi:putative ABC transport system permease protein
MRPAFDGVLGDLGLAARRLRATPLFLIFAVASISIGIATTTAAYSILYAILWKPLGIHQPERVVTIGAKSMSSGVLLWRSAATLNDFDAIAARQQTLEDLSALSSVRYMLQTPSSSELASFEAVTARFFQTMGLQAARGRMLQPEDDAQGAQVVVLSDRTWRMKFSADPEVVGKSVRIGGRPFEIVGVAPDSFVGILSPVAPVAGWMPMSPAIALAAQFGINTSEERGRQRYALFGRLADGRTVTEASSEIEAIGAALDVSAPTREIPMANGDKIRLPRGWTLRPIEEADDNSRQSSGALLLLMLIGLVLVVACTNLGNLTLSRGAYREHELAVRRALGASRWRLIRELFAETVLIATLASICTVLLTRLLLSLATQDISMPVGTMSFAPRLNAPAAAVSAAALAISMLVFGLEPAFALTRDRAARSLADGVATFGAGRNSRQRAFIRWQVAISVCFFLIAATIMKAVGAQAFHDSGIALNELAIASIGSSAQADTDRIRRSLERAAVQARQHSDLRSVAITTGMPFGLTTTPFALLTLPGTNQPRGVQPPMAGMIAASPEIFGTLGVPIVRGRQFDDRDAVAASHVAVVNENVATRFFGSLDGAVGRSINLQPWGRGPLVTFTVIGIARQTDVDRVMKRRPDDYLAFVPMHEATGRYFALVARTTGSPAAAARVLQDALRTADSDLGTGQSGPATWLVATPYVIGRFAAAIAGSLCLLTLTLAMIGLYGVQIQAVLFRTREMGIRMALGAAAAHIKGMVLRQGIRPVVEGVLLGTFFGAAVRGLLRAYIDDKIQIIDPAVFGAVPIPFAIAALIACYLPARRAAGVDPNVALRHL